MGPRKSGVEIIGDVSWGAHFCQFYETKQDLIDTLVPYFVAGLESNEFCMWVTSEPLGVEDATQALRESVPDIDRRMMEGQIEIIHHTDWYLLGGAFDGQRVLNGWVQKLEAALARGYEGLRLTGNTFWLEKDDWQDFTDYEEAVNSVIGSYRMLALCTYSVDKCGAGEIADVVANHEFAMMKRRGEWTIIENSTARQAKQALQTALDQLEATNEELVAGSEELATTNDELRVTEEELRGEIEQRRLVEQALGESERRVRLRLDSILSPEGDMGELELADILDTEPIQSLMDSFYELAHIPMAIIDLKGKVLVGVGWQDICTKFHRVHPETCRHCIESDTQLTQGVPPGESRLYRCENNMWDVSTPIMVGGEHVGNLFSGQFFFDDEPLDYDLFRSQARQYGFDEGDYIAALERVVRLSRKSLDEAMAFFMKLAEMLSKLSYSNIKLARSLSEREALTEALKEQRDLLTATASNTRAHLVYLDRDFNFIWVNPAYAEACARTQEEFVGHNHFEFYPHEENQAIFERVRDTGIPFETREKPFVFPDHPEWGVTYWDWTLTPVIGIDGTTRSLVFSLMDVTHDVVARHEIERLRAEAESRAAEMESVFSSLADGLAIFSAEGKILLANKAARTILGAPDDMPLDAVAAQYRLCTLDGEPLTVEQYGSRRALRGEHIKDERFMLVTPWTEVVVAESASPILDSSGRAIGATVLFRDQTDRVAFELERQQLLEREHHIAEVLQQALIPDTSYNIPGCDIAVRYEAALKEAEVGGDFYDVFDLGDNKIGILIGDVAGKGLAAAIQVAAARHSFRAYAYIDPRPGRVMTLVNDALCRNPQQDATFLTAFFAVLDQELGAITFANGGHETPVLRRTGGTVEELSLEGRALGVLEGYEYPDRGMILRPGDLVTMVTDGILEARNISKDMFGLRGMKSFLSERQRPSAADLADGLLAAAREHADGVLRDDAAILVFGLRREKKAR